MILLLILGLLVRRCWKEIEESYGVVGIILAIIVFIVAEILGRTTDILK